MQDYAIHRSSRKCHKDHRLFEPSERYYSVVLQKGGELVRHDYGNAHWNGPPEGAVGWWVSQMPAKKTGKLTPAPTHVLLDTLERLCESPDEAELAFVLALLLVRRRALSDMDEESLSDDASFLRLHASQDSREFTVRVCQPSPTRSEQLQQLLIELLYCES